MTDTEQAYVSRELTHFLGRSLGSDEERFQLLLKVLKSGELRWGPGDEHIETQGFGSHAIVANPAFFNRESDLYQIRVVCFCDIPRTQLSIHTAKYGKFGIAFDKKFLANKGANPVWYYGANSEYAAPGSKGEERWNLLKENLERAGRLQVAAMKAGDNPFGKELINLTMFLDAQVFSFLKPFEIGLTDDNEKNFYMEREWRMHGGLIFSVDEISCVFVPKGFAARLKSNFPQYVGEIVEL